MLPRMRLSRAITRAKTLLNRATPHILTTSSLPSSPLSKLSLSSRPDPETLFACTSSRWLCNDELQRKLRYTPFNVEALERIACDNVGAQRCFSWKKIGEGSFNKVFLLQFDNDKRTVVRVPCPVIANVEGSVASEVATMSYVSERWSDSDMAKPPRVIAWSASHNNPAGTPYVILDYAEGVTLGSRWAHIEGIVAYAPMLGILEMECFLLNHCFSQHGSLYFAEDVAEELRERPLYPIPPEDELHKRLAAKYCIGPTVDREWWRGGYRHVDANRGPWPNMQTMIQSAAELQLRAIDNAVIDYTSPFVKTKPSDIPLLRRLLKLCIEIAPLIVPPQDILTTPVLNHPDLSLSNIIVSPDGPASVVNTIDWEGATVGPFCVQCTMPPAFEYSGIIIPVPKDGSMPLWPENFESMSEEDKKVIREHHRYACRHKAYLEDMQEVDPTRVVALGLPHAPALSTIVLRILRCGTDGPQALRRVLVAFQQNWSRVINDDGNSPCPIDFSEEELAADVAEHEAAVEYNMHTKELYAEIGCAADTSVETGRFAAAKEVVERRRAEWDEAAMKGPFPIYEGAPSWFFT